MQCRLMFYRKNTKNASIYPLLKKYQIILSVEIEHEEQIKEKSLPSLKPLLLVIINQKEMNTRLIRDTTDKKLSHP